MSGPRLLSVIASAVAVMCTVILVTVHPGDVAAHTMIRWTARTSFVLFALAYAARPATQLRPTRLTRGLLAQRKWLGLGYATSHAFHLAAIIALAWPDPKAFIRAQDPTILVAVATFILVFAMAITSIEGVKRTMSFRSWKRLHRAGMQASWVVFATTYLAALAKSLLYLAPVAVLAAIAAIRFRVWRRGRRIHDAQARHAG
jgi:sulfoxide reductase heme-binding subunit YedZ